MGEALERITDKFNIAEFSYYKRQVIEFKEELIVHRKLIDKLLEKLLPKNLDEKVKVKDVEFSIAEFFLEIQESLSLLGKRVEVNNYNIQSLQKLVLAATKKL